MVNIKTLKPHNKILDIGIYIKQNYEIYGNPKI